MCYRRHMCYTLCLHFRLQCRRIAHVSHVSHSLCEITQVSHSHLAQSRSRDARWDRLLKHLSYLRFLRFPLVLKSEAIEASLIPRFPSAITFFVEGINTKKLATTQDTKTPRFVLEINSSQLVGCQWTWWGASGLAPQFGGVPVDFDIITWDHHHQQYYIREEIANVAKVGLGPESMCERVNVDFIYIYKFIDICIYAVCSNIYIYLFIDIYIYAVCSKRLG